MRAQIDLIKVLYVSVSLTLTQVSALNANELNAQDIIPPGITIDEEIERNLAHTYRSIAQASTQLPTAKCDNSASANGDFEEDRRLWVMKSREGQITFSYDAYSIPDRFAIYYDGVLLWASAGAVSGARTIILPYGPGRSDKLEVVVNEGGNNDTGTAWQYQLRCAGEIVLRDENLPASSNQIEKGGIAWITAGNPPLMPNLTAELPLATRPPNVWWTLEGALSGYSADRPNRDQFRIKDVPISGSAKWIIRNTEGDYSDIRGFKSVQNLGIHFLGGNYKISAAEKKLRSLDFKVLGKNPGNTSVISLIGQNTTFSWAKYIAYHETLGQVYNDNLCQFYGSRTAANKVSKREGLPIFGAPDGWGIMQIDSKRGSRITAEERWNWTANVRSGCQVLNAKVRDAQRIFNEVKTAFSTVSGYSWEDPPPNLKITLSYKGGLTREIKLPVLDAIAIIYYNGATFRTGGKQSFPKPDGKFGTKSTPLVYNWKKESGSRFSFTDNINHYLAKVANGAVQNSAVADGVSLSPYTKVTFELSQ